MTVAQLIVVFLICSSKLCVFVIKLISFASINLIVQTQLHSYSKAECVSGCNGAVQFNNQLQMRYSECYDWVNGKKTKNDRVCY